MKSATVMALRPDASYHGMWMLKERESGYSFYISPKGRGILVILKLGPEKLLPFDWNAAYAT